MGKPINIPTFSYELNTMVRKHREAKSYTQEEFAFLIGKSLEEIQENEDLTSDSSYDINYTNFYARILEKKPKEMFFEDSFEEANINVIATKTIVRNTTVNYKGRGQFNGKHIEIESYSLPIEPAYDITENDEEIVLALLDSWLRKGYFITGVTGYTLFRDLLAQHTEGKIQLPDSFRPILVSRAITTMCGRRKKPKLLPHRKLPKTPEKWLLYKEDV